MKMIMSFSHLLKCHSNNAFIYSIYAVYDVISFSSAWLAHAVTELSVLYRYRIVNYADSQLITRLQLALQWQFFFLGIYNQGRKNCQTVVPSAVSIFSILVGRLTELNPSVKFFFVEIMFDLKTEKRTLNNCKIIADLPHVLTMYVERRFSPSAGLKLSTIWNVILSFHDLSLQYCVHLMINMPIIILSAANDW